MDKQANATSRRIPAPGSLSALTRPSVGGPMVGGPGSGGTSASARGLAPAAEPKSIDVVEILAVIDAARAVEQATSMALRRLHPTLGATHAFVLLRLIRMAPASRADIQARMTIAGSTLASILAGLESEKLIERFVGDDRRRAMMVATDKGFKAAKCAEQQLERIAVDLQHNRQKTPFGLGGAALLHSALAVMTSAERLRS